MSFKTIALSVNYHYNSINYLLSICFSFLRSQQFRKFGHFLDPCSLMLVSTFSNNFSVTFFTNFQEIFSFSNVLSLLKQFLFNFIKEYTILLITYPFHYHSIASLSSTSSMVIRFVIHFWLFYHSSFLLRDISSPLSYQLYFHV